MRVTMGVAAVAGALAFALPASAQATEANATVIPPVGSGFSVSAATTLAGGWIAPTRVDVTVEPAGPGEVRITEHSSPLTLGTQDLVLPRVLCRYATLLRSAICPGAQSGSVRGDDQDDRFLLRGFAGSFAGTLGGGADVLTLRDTGPGGPCCATAIGIDGGPGDDAIDIERGSMTGGPGADRLVTPGGGTVTAWADSADRVDVADGEDGDEVTWCRTAPAVLDIDVGDRAWNHCP